MFFLIENIGLFNSKKLAMRSQMLERKDSRDLVLKTEGVLGKTSNIFLETKFMEVDVRSEESVSGQQDLWTKITTRPAFEVAFLKKTENEIRVILMRKRRKAVDQPLTKLPGGYLWEPPETYIAEKIRKDTGIQFSYNDLRQLGHVIGHSEIHTPIELYWTDKWEAADKPREGVEIVEISLLGAVQMAMDYGVENDSSFTALLRLYFIMKEGQLNL